MWQKKNMLNYFKVPTITKIFQLVLFAVEEERRAVVFGPGFGQALETSQVLQDLGGLQLIAPLVGARSENAERERGWRKTEPVWMNHLHGVHDGENPATPTRSRSVAGHSRSCIWTGSGSPGRSRSRRPSHHGSAGHSRRQRFSGLYLGAGNRSSHTAWVMKSV